MNPWLLITSIVMLFLSVNALRISRRRGSGRGRGGGSRRRRIHQSTTIRGHGNEVVQTSNFGRFHGNQRVNKRIGRNTPIFRQRVRIQGNSNRVFQHIRCRKKREITEMIECDFTKYDLNADGVVPYEEFIQANPYQEFDKDVLFNMFDNVDGNGLITNTEFRIGAQLLGNMGYMKHCDISAIADGPCFS